MKQFEHIHNGFDYFLQFQKYIAARIVWPYSFEKDSLYRGRAFILSSILITGLCLGLFALIAAIILIVKENAWGLAIVDFTALVLGLLFLFVHRIRFEIRASISLLMFYVIGIAVILSVGPLSGGPFWLFAFAVLAGVLMGKYAAFTAILMNAIFLSAVGILMSTGKYGNAFPFFNSPQGMIAAGINFMVLNAITAVSVSALVTGLFRTYKEKEDLTQHLEKEKRQLIKTQQSLELEIKDRKLTEKTLRESEEKFRTAFHTSPDAINLNRFEDGLYLDINQGFTKIMGYSQEDVMGKSSIKLNIWKNINDRNRLVSGLKKHGVVENLEANFIGKDGRIRTGLMSACLMHIHNKAAILSITRDITEQRKIEAQLQQSQKMESIGTLAGGIAHDFNNLLFPILGHTELLLMDTHKNQAVQDSLNQIHTAVLRARDLVKQILTFSRQENRELMLMKMQPIVKEALKLIRSIIPAMIDIKQDIDPDCGVIKADPTQIHQILMNLMTNAYHAMEETGGDLKVSLKQMDLCEQELPKSGMKPGSYACLTVADSGTGMDEKLTEKIFDPFFTTKKTGKGTGMGLSVVHGIVTAIGGAVQIKSVPGKGTEFNVYFPVEKRSSEGPGVQVKGQIQGGSEQILLVDDEEAILAMEKQMLERFGYQITSCTSSLEALEVFRGSPDRFDLVITDMAMPNMPGDKLSAELIKLRPDIPVVLCTGFSETMSEKKAAFLGIKGFLLKPIIMDKLARKIREVLN